MVCHNFYCLNCYFNCCLNSEDCQSSLLQLNESGVYDDYKDIELKIVDSIGYTDVVGLTKEEFKRLEKLLEEQ